MEHELTGKGDGDHEEGLRLAFVVSEGHEVTVGDVRVVRRHVVGPLPFHPESPIPCSTGPLWTHPEDRGDEWIDGVRGHRGRHSVPSNVRGESQFHSSVQLECLRGRTGVKKRDPPS